MTLIPAVRGSDRYVIGIVADFTDPSAAPPRPDRLRVGSLTVQAAEWAGPPGGVAVAADSVEAQVAAAAAARPLENGRLLALMGNHHLPRRQRRRPRAAPSPPMTPARTAGVGPLPAALNGVVACRETHSYPMVK
ncbi:hypothetical protein [Streptomyces sp. NPDC005533]|uniref:hypothetical protein n=1 Tax=Streptomyces sp. NPDC005533 TaxID=3364723 RepID=UPI0036B4F8E5